MQKKSFAKINLYLEVVGKRPDNYHLLDSLMVLIDIFDVIEIKENDELRLEIKGDLANYLSNDWQENIIIKTVNLLSKKYNFSPKIKITLEKNIPIAAGLGGGSSNAATIILMLNEFYQLNLKQEEMLEFGLEIGADVPFFLNSSWQKHSATFISGIGEKMNEVGNKLSKNLNFSLLLINPNQPISTQEVFKKFTKEEVLSQKKFLDENQNILEIIKSRNNDLERVSIKILPEIGEIIEELKQQQGCLLARMSGSGASCFAIFDNDNNLDKSYEILKKIFPNFYLKKANIF